MSLYAQATTQIQQAVQLFQAGQAAAAAAALQRVLQAQPRNFDALHILGVIRAMQGQRAEAIELFRKALAINKNHSLLQFNMAKALTEMGRDEEALVHHRWATKLTPDHAEAWLNYGLSLMQLHHLDDAAAAFEKATAIHPAYADGWSNLGLVRTRLGAYESACQALQKALTLQPGLAEACNNMGIALDGMHRSDEALACYERALDINPSYGDAWLNKAIRLVDLNRHKEALECFDQAIKFLAQPAKAWNYKAISWLASGEPDEAMACYRAAIAAEPDNAEAQGNLGQLLLQRGEFSAGWELLEQRWNVGEEAPKAIATRRPLWNGQASDKTLLVWGEQGIGDQVLYGSLLADLAAFPQRKLVALDRRLVSLFARSFPGFEFVDLAEVSDKLDFAEQIPLGSLPRLFRPDLPSFSKTTSPFLQPDPHRVEALRAKVVQTGKRVCGISWSSTRKVLGKHKTIDLQSLLGALATNNLHFVDLQYGDTAEERAEASEKLNIEVQHIEEVDAYNDLDGLAALIAACDLVISTSNSTAHLAGALGKETLLLLPSGKRKIWYWSEFDGRNLWYHSIRSFAQCEPGQWQQPLTLLTQYLENKTWN